MVGAGVLLYVRDWGSVKMPYREPNMYSWKHGPKASFQIRFLPVQMHMALIPRGIFCTLGFRGFQSKTDLWVIVDYTLFCIFTSPLLKEIGCNKPMDNQELDTQNQFRTRVWIIGPRSKTQSIFITHQFYLWPLGGPLWIFLTCFQQIFFILATNVH